MDLVDSSGNFFHKSVLVNEVLEYLAPFSGGLYLDATFGGGGHTRAILEHEPGCRVLAFDWDKNALEKNAPSIKDEFGDRFESFWGSFSSIPKILKKEKIFSVDGILGDFGTSQYQLSSLDGFSFLKDSKLDMRMSPAHQKLTAYDYVNRSSLESLQNILRKYGEERHYRIIAKAILRERRKKRISTTKQLASIVESTLAFHKRGLKRRRIHPATRVFQALRIVVNDELSNIEVFLKNSIDLLKTGGRLVAISFHSLEDRLVKNFLRENKESFKILTKKVVMASSEEKLENPSARSAKLRAGERL